ncbi:MAG: AAA family ATPase [Lachnospiraceae bacterium]|nr:AAA family ATPase [Lachnospiraceae bacterium]
MSEFDKVIGYDNIKNDLIQVCDMVKNPEIYKRLGAQIPRGILLSGDPGLGKTLLAKCFIKECGLKTFVIRRNRGTDDFIGKITHAFEEAKDNAPSIVFLDDMDKFANEDRHHRDAEEYVAVQAGIDEVKNYDVLVIATVNNIDKLPGSLKRVGRFDRTIEIEVPTEEDAEKIIKHYLKNKITASDVNLEDLGKMFRYSSCAELETVLNEAAVGAGYLRKSSIEMSDFVNAVLSMQYHAPADYTKGSKEEIRKTALHEAGHVVVCEALKEGSVGLVSIRVVEYNGNAGFTHRCKEIEVEDSILVCLAGKAATELYYSDRVAQGCSEDLDRAYRALFSYYSEEGCGGLSLLDDGVFNGERSEHYISKIEPVIGAALERYLTTARGIILKNRPFLEKLTEALIEKETLLYSDIRRIKAETMGKAA